MIRLIVADDHAIVRQGLVALLEDESGLKVVGQAGTGREAMALVRQHRPDIALLDIAMPDMTGLEAASHITTELPEVKVVILTMHEEQAFFFEALRVGAAGYILKGAHSDELLRAIRAIYEGGVYLMPKLARAIVQDYVDRHSQLPVDEALTSREREILTLIAQGLTCSDIAERLTLSINTVKTHRLHIYRKLGFHSRAELVDYALSRRLLYA
jgi:DNA-binding NarL/FixJ family response regulator